MNPQRSCDGTPGFAAALVSIISCDWSIDFSAYPSPGCGISWKPFAVSAVAPFQDMLRDHFHSQRLFGFWTRRRCSHFCSRVIAALYAIRSADRRKSAALPVYSVLPFLLVFLGSRLSTPIYINRLFTGASVLLPLVLCAPIAFQVGNRKRLFQFIALVVLVGTATFAKG
jgi:hypothetical protein